MLSDNIKVLRKNRGFTQEELAARLHVTRQTVSKWEHGYSVPDAQILSDMADVLDVPVSELLGADKPKQEEPDAVAEQLSRINEQLAAKNLRTHRIWKTVLIIVLAVLIGYACTLAFYTLPMKSEQETEAGRTSWQCTLNGKTYEYMVTYNKNYQVLCSGGDAYISYHTDVEKCDDANELAVHLKDYFDDHGGSVKVTEQENLQLIE